MLAVCVIKVHNAAAVAARRHNVSRLHPARTLDYTIPPVVHAVVRRVTAAVPPGSWHGAA